MRPTRFFSLLTTSTLALLTACGDTVDAPAIDVTAAAAEQPIRIDVHVPTTGPSLSSPTLGQVPFIDICEVNCSADELERLPIAHVGQQLDPNLLFQVAGTPIVSELNLRTERHGELASGPGAFDAQTSTWSCPFPEVCDDGRIDLQRAGKGLLQVTGLLDFAGEGGIGVVTFRVVDLPQAATIAGTWIDAVAQDDPLGVGIDVDATRALQRVRYAGTLFGVNPIAAFVQFETAITELELANATNFTQAFDPVIDLLTRSRFFASRALTTTTIALRSTPVAWDLLADDEIRSPSFPFNPTTPRAFPVDQGLLIADLQAGLDSLDVVAADLRQRDRVNAEDLNARSALQTFSADGVLAGVVEAGGDEDYYRLVNTGNAAVDVRISLIGNCSNAALTDHPILVFNGQPRASTGPQRCTSRLETLGPDAVVFIGVRDVDDDGRADYTLTLDFGNDGIGAVVLIAEGPGNDDGTPSVGGAPDATTIRTDNLDAIAARRELHSFATNALLTSADADALPTLRAAAILDGDDIVATVLDRATRTLPGSTRERRIFNNDADVSQTEPAYGRFVLESVAESIRDTVTIDDNGLTLGARSLLASALARLDRVSTTMAVFPEGFNDSPVRINQPGANQVLMRDVYLASQEAMGFLRQVQSSVIDTTSWQAGIAIGLASVSRFSAFTGSRPMSGFRADDSVASFECRFGKTLLDLQVGDYDRANSLFDRSICQLIDVYNNRYASGTLTDAQRIPDDQCIDPQPFNCPIVVGNPYPNGCLRVDSNPLQLANARDPGWSPNAPSNCGVGSRYRPEPVAVPSTTAFNLPSIVVEPDPRCVRFQVATAGPLSVSTGGTCVFGDANDATGLTVEEPDGTITSVTGGSSGDGSTCAQVRFTSALVGDYLACAVNNSLTGRAVNDVELQVGAELVCLPGTFDVGTTCQSCTSGTFCAGGSSPPQLCAALFPAQFDHDGNPATPCLPAPTSLVRDAFIDLDPLGSGSTRVQQLLYDEVGNAYELRRVFGPLGIDIGFGQRLTVDGRVGSAVIVKRDPSGFALWTVRLGEEVTNGQLALANDALIVLANTRQPPAFERFEGALLVEQTSGGVTGTERLYALDLANGARLLETIAPLNAGLLHNRSGKVVLLGEALTSARTVTSSSIGAPVPLPPGELHLLRDDGSFTIVAANADLASPLPDLEAGARVLVNVDAAGAELSRHVYAATFASEIVDDGAGGLYVLGNRLDDNLSELMHFGPDGTRRWVRTGPASIRSLAVTPGGRVRTIVDRFSGFAELDGQLLFGNGPFAIAEFDLSGVVTITELAVTSPMLIGGLQIDPVRQSSTFFGLFIDFLQIDTFTAPVFATSASNFIVRLNR